MRVESLPGPLGARVFDLDLRRAPDAATREALCAAIDRHGVLVLPQQDIDDDAQVAFSQGFGELEVPLDFDQYAGVHRLVTRLANVGNDGELMAPDSHHVTYMRGNELWHTDSSFKSVPAKYSILHAREIPDGGGETEFADCRDAYDAWGRDGLSPPLEELEDLMCEHSIVWSRSLIIGDFFTAEEKAKLPPVEQRLIRVHPATGRRSFYAGSHASHVKGWPLDEGRALIAAINAHCTRPERIYRHRWQAHDLVIWDNRSVLHRGRPHDPRQRRVMHRTTVRGDASTLREVVA
jgi:alpha-ketoglutarate-dependent 2,4-dichlorophenoxyacetate dioxygenase